MKQLILIPFLVLLLSVNNISGNSLVDSHLSESIETGHFMSQYLTRENITLALALFGAIGTALDWALKIIHSRKNISMQIIKNFQVKDFIVIFLAMQNNSYLPISINDISLIVNGTKYTGFSVPPHTLRYKDDTLDIPVDREHTTIPFPVNLGALAGASGYIRFDVSEEVFETLSTPLTFQVSTNRGSSIQMKLESAEWVCWKSML